MAGCEDVAAFARVDEDFREVILADNLHVPLDPERWFTFGVVGLWLLVVVDHGSARPATAPPPLGYLAIATALSHWLIVLGDELYVWPLANLAFGGKVVLGSVFCIWVGRHLLRSPALGG